MFVWIAIGFVAGVVAALWFACDLHKRNQKLFVDAIEYYKHAELLHKNARRVHERTTELLAENEALGQKIDDKLREIREARN